MATDQRENHWFEWILGCPKKSFFEQKDSYKNLHNGTILLKNACVNLLTKPSSIYLVVEKHFLSKTFLIRWQNTYLSDFFISFKEIFFSIFVNRILEKKKQIVYRRSNILRVRRMGQNISIECNEFVSYSERYMRNRVVIKENNASFVCCFGMFHCYSNNQFV